MKAVAGSMPALMRAAKVVKRALQHGGSVPEIEASLAAWQKQPDGETLGDLLMALSARAHQDGVEAELSLNEAVDRYIRRFEAEESSR